MTAIRATYSDLKLVKTRKVLQLIFEVPIEEGDNALRVLGGLARHSIFRFDGKFSRFRGLLAWHTCPAIG